MTITMNTYLSREISNKDNSVYSPVLAVERGRVGGGGGGGGQRWGRDIAHSVASGYII
jgi:hypothetical protein